MARTIRTKIYKFTELSEKAKQKAMDWWREGETFDWIYDEAGESLKKFAEIFEINIRDFDFQEPYRSRYSFEKDDTILELKGWRLATYIWNNYRNDIYKGKWYNSWSSKNKINHRNVKSILKTKKSGWNVEPKNGEQEYWNVYRSSITIESSCPFTGVCYDDSLLDPMMKFLAAPSDRVDFKDLLEDCLSSLCKDVQSEIVASNEDENVAESIIANEYEFLKDGTKYQNIELVS